jgi:NADH-quinone oxidoreductase subunit N
MTELFWLIPEYLVAAAALVALFADVVSPRQGTGAALGAAAALVAAVTAVLIGARGELAGVLDLDQTAVVARVAMLVLTAVYLLWLSGRGMGPERSREAASLALLALLGGMFMATARDLITLFIAVELGTMPAYVLMGYRRGDDRSLEGALKYFLLSMTTSLVMLYGFSLLFGLSGSTSFPTLGRVGDAGLLGAFAALFSFTGLFAKVSAAPFHFWAPDTYAGAPAASVAFVSTVPKIAGTVVMVHLAAALAPGVPSLPAVFALVALTSMVLGNLAAFPQNDVRRLMAYSGVAHSGYVLLAVSAATPGGYAAAIFYTIVYAVPSMAVMFIAAEEGNSLDDFAGLAGRRPALGWASVVFLLSLVGVPPMAGMFGKLLVFTSAVDGGWLWLVVVAIVMSVASAGYYFRVLREVFYGERPEAPAPARSVAAAFALAACVTITLTLGLAAQPLLSSLGLAF